MSSPARTGVVLAAGFGSRLKGVVASTDLKPLTPVAGTPLIVRTLQRYSPRSRRIAYTARGERSTKSSEHRTFTTRSRSASDSRRGGWR